ncbi:hypothetical protein K7I13_07745 [Brucepastera parasyntrophica]|uniref:hypothetical protein n=1 Tax=Brucepastera parasyntrophica TaxID=2880008 RepID=UPI00210AFB70|nr:hypothetical protein [Brucepastera parasyntrophica]ULQ58470.1 hypothetical protein K7I13_07745 [Brucepastera parasyntrophica]
MIQLPDFHSGRYGCSEIGLVLVSGKYQAADYLKSCESGSLISVPFSGKNLMRDKKSGAIIIDLRS